MKIKVLARFVHGAVVVYPGEVLDVDVEEGEYLIERGIAKPVKPPKPKEEEEKA